ncbi:hypothetical protein LP419_09070 [Massilia sp. H-1]|nr:hypothetical protein LP419_09070 [Massilia sp. H-1]
MQEQASEHARRHPRPGASDRLILTELAPGAVIDHLDDDGSPVELITFGTVRETCPRCRQTHLKLVLRQRRGAWPICSVPNARAATTPTTPVARQP